MYDVTRLERTAGASAVLTVHDDDLWVMIRGEGSRRCDNSGCRQDAMNSDYRPDRAAADEVLHAYVTHLIEDEKRDSDERDRARANAERIASARAARIAMRLIAAIWGIGLSALILLLILAPHVARHAAGPGGLSDHDSVLLMAGSIIFVTIAALAALYWVYYFPLRSRLSYGRLVEGIMGLDV